MIWIFYHLFPGKSLIMHVQAYSQRSDNAGITLIIVMDFIMKFSVFDDNTQDEQSGLLPYTLQTAIIFLFVFH